LDEAIEEVNGLIHQNKTPEEIRSLLPAIKQRFRLVSLNIVEAGTSEYFVHGAINPEKNSENLPRNLKELVSMQAPVNSSMRGQVYYFADSPLKDKYPEGVGFNSLGFPIFEPYATPAFGGIKVRIAMLGNRSYSLPDGDFAKANVEAGFAYNYIHPDHTWHHHQDRRSMLLIPWDLHDGVRHSGGVWAIKKLGTR